MNFFDALIAEATAAKTLWIVGVVVLASVLVRERDSQRPRLKATVFLFGMHLVALGIHAVLRARDGAVAPEFRTLSWVTGTVTFVSATASLLFHGVLSRTRFSLPRIVEDVLVALVSVIASVTVASRAGMNLSGLIATSAVFTAILRFSLQDVIGNVASGLALQVDTSIGVGDWIKVGDVTGRVTEIRWRYTAVETRNWETVLLPNITLLRNQVVLLGRREGQARLWRRWVHFSVDWKHQPSDVMEVVQTAVKGAEISRVALDPPPNCILLDMTDSYGKYALRYWLNDLAVDDPTDSEVRTRIYFALQRAEMKMAMASYDVHLTEENSALQVTKGERQAERRKELLKAVGLFDTLEPSEIDELARTLRYAPFTRGEVITRQGAEAHWLYLVEEGLASVRVREGDVEREVAKLRDGCVFGEMSLLTGAPRTATVVAETDVECFRLERGAFKRVMERRPELAAHFAELLSKRSAELEAAREGLDEEAKLSRQKKRESDIFDRIRDFFGLA